MTPDSHSSGWTTVDKYLHPTDAWIAAGKLDSEGIPVLLLDINLASANWLISNALGGIRLQVPAVFADDALKLLAENQAEHDDGDVRCPGCTSKNVSAMTNGRKIALLVLHLFSLPFPWRTDVRHCDSCGREWAAEPGD